MSHTGDVWLVQQSAICTKEMHVVVDCLLLL